MKKHYRTDKHCLNCNTIVEDKFCPNCGQENLELREDFLHLIMHSVGHYFHFESKFFNSIVPLFTKPGFLTKEYFAGKRASHLNPISMYIFISILFFFLFTANSNSNKKDILEENAAEGKALASTKPTDVNADVTRPTAPKKAEDYTYTILNSAQTKTDSVANQSETIVYTNPAITKAAEIQEGKNKIAALADKTAAPGSLKAKFRQVLDDDLSGELFKNKLVSHLPKMMFILLPLFAFILMLVNYRSKKYYAEHLIYSIHVHSFLFLFGSVLILLSWIMPFIEGWIQFIGFLIMLWYIYRSMRNIYRSSRWRTIYKFSLLALAYGLLMLLSGVIVVIATLYTM